jgi:hypothetical protein
MYSKWFGICFKHPPSFIQKMPTITLAGALLVLSAPSNAEEAHPFADTIDEQPIASPSSTCSIPWCWPTWQQRTKLTSAPFSATVNEDTPCDWNAPDANHAVWTFVSNFWAVEDSAQVDYIKKKRTDNNSKGRDLWLEYFHTKWSDWKVGSTVDAILAERSLDPYSVMKRLKVANVRFIDFFLYSLFIDDLNKLPDLATSQVALAYPSLAEALFGADSFTEDGVAVKEPVRRFLDTLATHLWAKYRKSIGRERGRLAKLREKIDEKWKGTSFSPSHFLDIQ